METDHELIGKVGNCTGAIGPGTIGEVMVAVRGGTEAFYAYPATAPSRSRSGRRSSCSSTSRRGRSSSRGSGERRRRMWFYKVAEPNEALIVSGLRSHELPEGGGRPGLGFRIVVGRGVFVIPILQTRAAGSRSTSTRSSSTSTASRRRASRSASRRS